MSSGPMLSGPNWSGLKCSGRKWGGPMSSGPKSSGPMLSGPFLRGHQLWAVLFCGLWISNWPILWAPLFCGLISNGRPPVQTRRSGCAEHAHHSTPLERESTGGSGNCRPFWFVGFDIHQNPGVVRFSPTQNCDRKINKK